MQFLSGVQVMAREAGLDPATAGAELRRIAASFFLPFFCRQKPVAPLTKGTGVITLLSTTEQTQRVEVSFPYPVLVVGLSFVVTPAAFAAFAVDREDISVLLDSYDRERLLTTNEPNGAADIQAVNARSLDFEFRDTMLVLDAGERPKLGVTFRSRYAGGGVSGLPGNVLCSLDLSFIPFRP